MDRLPFQSCLPVWRELGLSWHPEQLTILKGDDRFPVIGGGERGGKSYVTCGIALPHIVLMPYTITERAPEKFWVTDPKTNKIPLDAKGQPVLNLMSEQKDYRPHQNPDVVIFGPHYKEPKSEFGYLRDWLRRLGKLNQKYLSEPRDGPQYMVTTDGVVITTWSMEKSTDIRSIDVELAIIVEAGNCPYDGVERVQGRVSGTRGPIIYNGTMELSEKWYRDWMLIGRRENDLGIVSYSLPAYTNRHQFPGGIDNPEIQRLKKVYTDDKFAMRILAEPRPPADRVVPEITNELVHEMEIPRDAIIEPWMDPGYASAYAIEWVAFWETEEENNEGVAPKKHFYIFDEQYEAGKTSMDMIVLAKQKPYWNRARSAIMDIAGQGHRDAGKSALETWQETTNLAFNMHLWPEPTLIERIRTSAKAAQITINPRCHGLLAECGLDQPVMPGMHHWKYMTDNEGNVTNENPVDRWNHALKALGYGLLHHLGVVEARRRSRGYNRMAAGYVAGNAPNPGRSVGKPAPQRAAPDNPGRGVASSRSVFNSRNSRTLRQRRSLRGV